MGNYYNREDSNDRQNPTTEDVSKLTDALRKEREGRKLEVTTLKTTLADMTAKLTTLEALGHNANVDAVLAQIDAATKAGVAEKSAELTAKVGELETSHARRWPKMPRSRTRWPLRAAMLLCVSKSIPATHAASGRKP